MNPSYFSWTVRTPLPALAQIWNFSRFVNTTIQNPKSEQLRGWGIIIASNCPTKHHRTVGVGRLPEATGHYNPSIGAWVRKVQRASKSPRRFGECRVRIFEVAILHNQETLYILCRQNLSIQATLSPIVTIVSCLRVQWRQSAPIPTSKTHTCRWITKLRSLNNQFNSITSSCFVNSKFHIVL